MASLAGGAWLAVCLGPKHTRQTEHKDGDRAALQKIYTDSRVLQDEKERQPEKNYDISDYITSKPTSPPQIYLAISINTL